MTLQTFWGAASSFGERNIFHKGMVCDSAGRAIYNRAMTDAISPEFHLTPGGPAPFRPSEWDMDDAAQ